MGGFKCILRLRIIALDYTVRIITHLCFSQRFQPTSTKIVFLLPKSLKQRWHKVTGNIVRQNAEGLQLTRSSAMSPWRALDAQRLTSEAVPGLNESSSSYWKDFVGSLYDQQLHCRAIHGPDSYRLPQTGQTCEQYVNGNSTLVLVSSSPSKAGIEADMVYCMLYPRGADMCVGLRVGLHEVVHMHYVMGSAWSLSLWRNFPC